MKQVVTAIFLGLLVVVSTSFAYMRLPQPTNTYEPGMATLPPPKGRSTQSTIINAERFAQYHHPFLPQTILPTPQRFSVYIRNLTLQDAILLALRNNPSVVSSELQRVIDKYNLEIARDYFRPHYQLGMTGTYSQGNKPNYQFAPDLTLISPIGTQFDLQYNTPFEDNLGYETFTITQPIFRGFGRVNRLNYEDALNNELAARLTFKSNIITVVINVITTFRALVTSYNQLEIEKSNVKQTQLNLRQYQLRVKAGKMATADLIQQRTTLAQAQLALMQNKISLESSYQNFLKALGLVPHANIKIDTKIRVKYDRLPSESQAIKIALTNNADYQKNLYQLENDHRALEKAEDNYRIEFDITASAQISNSDKTAPLGPLVSTTNGPSIGFKLSIPTDHLQNREAIAQARIAIENQEILLEQQKEDLVRNVTNQLSKLKSERMQITLAEQALALQKINLNNWKMQQRYGRASVYDVTQQQQNLLNAQTTLLNSQMTYLNDVTAFYQLLGTTLDRWNIKLRY